MRIVVLACGVAFSTVLTAGGWAVTTIERVPDYAVAGQPLRLEFTVRQHGQFLVSDLSPVVEARSGGALVKAAARAVTANPGRYAADMVLPGPGNWTLVITHALGPTTGISLPAVATAGQAPKAVAAADQGLRLFSAKGCAACHSHRAAPATSTSSYGPELTGRRYPLEVLTAKLAHPLPCAPGRPCMPVLDIRAEEVGPLAAFLNASERNVQTSASADR